MSFQEKFNYNKNNIIAEKRLNVLPDHLSNLSSHVYGFRKIIPDYTGACCRIAKTGGREALPVLCGSIGSLIGGTVVADGGFFRFTEGMQVGVLHFDENGTISKQSRVTGNFVNATSISFREAIGSWDVTLEEFLVNPYFATESIDGGSAPGQETPLEDQNAVIIDWFDQRKVSFYEDGSGPSAPEPGIFSQGIDVNTYTGYNQKTTATSIISTGTQTLPILVSGGEIITKDNRPAALFSGSVMHFDNESRESSSLNHIPKGIYSINGFEIYSMVSFDNFDYTDGAINPQNQVGTNSTLGESSNSSQFKVNEFIGGKLFDFIDDVSLGEIDGVATFFYENKTGIGTNGATITGQALTAKKNHLFSAFVHPLGIDQNGGAVSTGLVSTGYAELQFPGAGLKVDRFRQLLQSSNAKFSGNAHETGVSGEFTNFAGLATGSKPTIIPVRNTLFENALFVDDFFTTGKKNFRGIETTGGGTASNNELLAPGGMQLNKFFTNGDFTQAGGLITGTGIVQTDDGGGDALRISVTASNSDPFDRVFCTVRFGNNSNSEVRGFEHEASYFMSGEMRVQNPGALNKAKVQIDIADNQFKARFLPSQTTFAPFHFIFRDFATGAADSKHFFDLNLITSDSTNQNKTSAAVEFRNLVIEKLPYSSLLNQQQGGGFTLGHSGTGFIPTGGARGQRITFLGNANSSFGPNGFNGTISELIISTGRGIRTQRGQIPGDTYRGDLDVGSFFDEKTSGARNFNALNEAERAGFENYINEYYQTLDPLNEKHFDYVHPSTFVSGGIEKFTPVYGSSVSFRANNSNWFGGDYIANTRPQGLNNIEANLSLKYLAKEETIQNLLRKIQKKSSGPLTGLSAFSGSNDVINFDTLEDFSMMDFQTGIYRNFSGSSIESFALKPLSTFDIYELTLNLKNTRNSAALGNGMCFVQDKPIVQQRFNNQNLPIERVIQILGEVEYSDVDDGLTIETVEPHSLLVGDIVSTRGIGNLNVPGESTIGETLEITDKPVLSVISPTIFRVLRANFPSAGNHDSSFTTSAGSFNATDNKQVITNAHPFGPDTLLPDNTESFEDRFGAEGKGIIQSGYATDYFPARRQFSFDDQGRVVDAAFRGTGGHPENARLLKKFDIISGGNDPHNQLNGNAYENYFYCTENPVFTSNSIDFQGDFGTFADTTILRIREDASGNTLDRRLDVSIFDEMSEVLPTNEYRGYSFTGDSLTGVVLKASGQTGQARLVTNEFHPNTGRFSGCFVSITGLTGLEFSGGNGLYGMSSEESATTAGQQIVYRQIVSATTGDARQIRGIATKTGIVSDLTRTFFFKPDNQVVISVDHSNRFNNFRGSFKDAPNIGRNQNSLQNLQLTFTNRSDKETYAMLHFLETHMGYKSFVYYYGDDIINENRQFYCDNWSHTFNHFDSHTIKATFTEVVQPIGNQGF